MTPNPPAEPPRPPRSPAGEHIRPEWVEAAAEALARARVEAAWRDMGSLTRAAYRLLARATLTAVVPAIQAQALEEAANGIQNLHPGQIKASVGWLRGRARLIERGVLP